MVRIHILAGPKRRPWQPVAPYWYPVYRSREQLHEMGFDVIFHRAPGSGFMECDVALLCSFHPELRLDSAESREAATALVQRLADAGTATVWVDMRDGTGGVDVGIIRHVDRYLKKQILKDRKGYRETPYGGRVYTGYFHDRFGVTDTEPDDCVAVPDDQERKLGVAWNIGLSDFRGAAYLPLNLLHNYRERAGCWRDVTSARTIDALACYNVSYSRETVNFQRKKALAILGGFDGASCVYGARRVSKPRYLRLVSKAGIVVSMFGCGEICYREFEAFMGGAAVVMPRVDHMETWPDVYVPNETFVPVAWDLRDLEDTLRHLLAREDLRQQVARAGQAAYRRFWTRDGRDEFCRHFAGIIERVLHECGPRRPDVVV